MIWENLIVFPVGPIKLRKALETEMREIVRSKSISWSCYLIIFGSKIRSTFSSSHQETYFFFVFLNHYDMKKSVLLFTSCLYPHCRLCPLRVFLLLWNRVTLKCWRFQNLQHWNPNAIGFWFLGDRSSDLGIWTGLFSSPSTQLPIAKLSIYKS